MAYTWKSPRPHNEHYDFQSAHGLSGVRYTAPSGRAFEVHLFRASGEIVAWPLDDPFYSYWGPSPCWPEMKASIDFDNPAEVQHV